MKVSQLHLNRVWCVKPLFVAWEEASVSSFFVGMPTSPFFRHRVWRAGYASRGKKMARFSWLASPAAFRGLCPLQLPSVTFIYFIKETLLSLLPTIILL